MSSQRTPTTPALLNRCTTMCFLRMSETARPTLQPSTSSDSDLLWGFWYPALRSRQLRGKKLSTAMLLELPLVLGRDEVQAILAELDGAPRLVCTLLYGQEMRVASRVVFTDRRECYRQQPFPSLDWLWAQRGLNDGYVRRPATQSASGVARRWWSDSL